MLLTMLLAPLGALLIVPGARGQQSGASEYEVKAAYLYSFGRFVVWPANMESVKDEAFQICVLGQDPFGSVLDAVIAGEAIGDRIVVATRVSKPQDALNCRVLFISTSEESRLGEILPVFDKVSVLTVSDMPRFTRRGGMIQFHMERNRVRFEVNLKIAQGAGLTLSSDLLKVATAVRRNARPGD